jgi:formylglycine-generating enzyme required for sulfatase activity
MRLRLAFLAAVAVPFFAFSAEPPAGAAIVHPGDGAVMVYVPAGPFVMGLDPAEAETVARALGAKDAAQLWMWECYPKRSVELPGYFIDRTETTVGQWQRFVEATGFTSTPKEVSRHFGKPDELDLPVGEVGQEDARAFAAWAGKALPSDAQWEKACRGTDGRFWPWGNTPPTPELANLGPHTRDRAYEKVGSHPKGASPYGCQDMVGNQYEWTDGRVTPYPGNPEAARMATYNASSNRCVRGGSFYHGFKSGYACKRMGFERDATYFHLGFRCVWVPPPGWLSSPEYDKARQAAAALSRPSD